MNLQQNFFANPDGYRVDEREDEELDQIKVFINSCNHYRDLIASNTIYRLYDQYQPNLLKDSKEAISVNNLIYYFLHSRLTIKQQSLIFDEDFISSELLEALEAIRELMKTDGLSLEEIDQYYAKKRADFLGILLTSSFALQEESNELALKLSADIECKKRRAMSEFQEKVSKQNERKINQIRSQIQDYNHLLDDPDALPAKEHESLKEKLNESYSILETLEAKATQFLESLNQKGCRGICSICPATIR